MISVVGHFENQFFIFSYVTLWEIEKITRIGIPVLSLAGMPIFLKFIKICSGLQYCDKSIKTCKNLLYIFSVLNGKKTYLQADATPYLLLKIEHSWNKF